MSIYVTPIPRLTPFAAPALTLGLANAAGTAETALSTDSTLLAFDGTLPDAISYSQSGATGSAVVASRRDHAHAMAAQTFNLVVIGTAVADDSANLTITGLDSTYDTYLLTATDMVPASDGSNIGIQVGDSGGIDTGASDYGYHTMAVLDSSDSYAANVSVSSNRILLPGAGIGNQPGEGFGCSFWLNRPADGTSKPTFSGTGTGLDVGGALSGGAFVGERTAVITLDRVLIRMDAGNITSGRFTIWGLKNA